MSNLENIPQKNRSWKGNWKFNSGDVPFEYNGRTGSEVVKAMSEEDATFCIKMRALKKLSAPTEALLFVSVTNVRLHVRIYKKKGSSKHRTKKRRSP